LITFVDFVQALTKLSLGYSKIGNEGARHFGQALRHNKVIIYLSTRSICFEIS